MSAAQTWTRGQAGRRWRSRCSGWSAARSAPSIDLAGFFRAWLCTYLFWLGLPLAGVTLVLVHDLSGGNWMATARPALDAAIVTMPLATLAGIPAFVGLHALYSWTHPAPSLGNTFYLNSTGFYLRYAIDVVLWNLLAAFALWGPRGEAAPIAPGLSWLSGIGLIYWHFPPGSPRLTGSCRSSRGSGRRYFRMSRGRLVQHRAGIRRCSSSRSAACARRAPRPHGRSGRDPARDDDFLGLCRVHAVPDHLGGKPQIRNPLVSLRMAGIWKAALYVSIGFGFVAPFFVLLWRPGKRSRAIVATISL